MSYKLQFMNLILGLAAVASFTSCNDDDDFKTLTKEEKAQCYQTVRGNYSGKLIYTTGDTKGGKNVSDTLEVNWAITTDSTLTIKQVPARVYAVYVSNAELKKALAEAPAQDLVCRTNYVQQSPVGFYLNPVFPTYTLNYGGADHKVQVAFYTNSNISSAIYDTSTKTMQMQVAEGAIYIDSKQSGDLKNGSAFTLIGKKL